MLEKAIVSKEYRDFLIANNVHVTDWQLATLIYNNTHLPTEEKAEALKQLAESTSDAELKTQIVERLPWCDQYMGDQNRHRFEEKGVDLPLLFRTGDIVRIIGTGYYGIVDGPDNDEEEVRMRELMACSEYVDFQVAVNTIFNGDKYLTIFSHQHVSPAMLEHATFDEKDKRKEFLEYMVEVVYKSPWFGKPGRDVNRIPEVLRTVETIWKQFPDLRLGQLLLCACGPKDLFAIEDEELVKCLESNKWGARCDED